MGATAGWRYSLITLTDFLPEKILKTALRCAQFSWHFLIFSQSSDHLFVVNIPCTFYFLECLVSSHIITLPFSINSGVISVWNIDGGYFSLISSCQKYRGGHARTLKIGPLDGDPRFLFEQLKGLHSCRHGAFHDMDVTGVYESNATDLSCHAAGPEVKKGASTSTFSSTYHHATKSSTTLGELFIQAIFSFIISCFNLMLILPYPTQNQRWWASLTGLLLLLLLDVL